MGQGYSQTLPPGLGVIEATADLSDLTFEKSLGGTRFLRTIRARFQQGVVVAKLCQKANPQVSFKKYAAALQKERRQLRDIANVLPYQRIRETSSLGLLVRQYIHTSLYDRISIRPFLENIEKKWIAFQLLCAVRDCHSRQVFHGDIKSENVLVTSWGWVYLTDFASTFKPVYLPEDNPADFSFYYDTSARRTCYIAPERFLAAGEKPNEDNVVQWNMDIFSLGCVLAELFTEAPTFTLHQLFRYRKGEYDPTLALLNKIDDDHVRALISSMIRLDPQDRWHAQDYLDEYKGKAFPLYFYQHFHTLMHEITDPTSGRKPAVSADINNAIPDDRIDRIYDDFEMLSVSLGYEGSLDGQTLRSTSRTHALFPLQIDLPNNRHSATTDLNMNGDNGTFILVNIVTSSVRSAARASTKVKACELLLAFAERLPDEAKLDRILPYVVPLLEDVDEMVLVAALRTMTQLLALVTVISPVNSSLFSQYVFPRLQTFVSTKGFKSNPIVRATYAQCLSSLAETASRFLDLTTALKTEGTMLGTGKSNNDDLDSSAVSIESYDATRAELIEQFELQTKIFLTDHDTAVKRAFLTSVPSLCVFLGEHKAADVLLSHLNTYLNDPDWQLKCAFFRTIVGVAIFIGGARLEEFVLPLILQALTDPQEFVVEQALRSLSTMAEVGLLQRAKTWELIDTVARFLMHPNMWIKEAAAHFISAATTYLSTADIRILVMPLVQPYLKVPINNLTESELLDTLKKPLSRAVLDLALSWAQKVERGLFWKSAKESKQLSYRGVTQMPPTSSVAELGPRSLARTPKTDEDEQWLGRLRNAGLRGEDEVKLLAFREYLWRSAQRQKRHTDAAPTPSIYDHVLSLTKLKVNLQTVIFDSDLDAYERRVSGQAERTIAEALEEATSPAKEMPFRMLQLNGFSDDQAGLGSSSPRPIEAQAARIPALRQPASGSLSSSPSSAIGLLGKDSERTLRPKSSAAALMRGAEHSKAQAAVATDDATAAGRLNSPITSERPTSRQSRPGAERKVSSRPIHNYTGNDPAVLKLLDAVYVDNFSIDAAEFGPLIQPIKRGPIPSSSVTATAGNWRPQSQLVTVLAEHTAKVTRIVVSPDCVFFLTGSDDGCVKVWDTSRLERNVTHRSRSTFQLAPGVKVTSLCFVDSTHTFICTGSDGSVHVVKVEVSEASTVPRYGKNRVLREWQIPQVGVTAEYAAWTEHYRSDSASMLMLATNLGRILAVDLRYMTVVYELRNPARHGTPTCFCVGRRHDWLLVGTTQGVLDLWDLRFRLRLRSWTFHDPSPIVRLQLHPSRRSARRNRVCISGGTGHGEFSVWDIEKVICHEVYRPANAHVKERLHVRDYELHNLEDGQVEEFLNRATAIDWDTSETALKTFTHFGLHQSPDDTEALHAFAISGGPDNRVRFWDCDRLETCKVISGLDPEEKAVYSYSQLALDTRIVTEKLEQIDTPKTTGIMSPPSGGTPSKRTTPAPASSGSKPARYDTIRDSARQLLNGHLDTITDVALLERPFGMVVSADRSGQVFICQ